MLDDAARRQHRPHPHPQRHRRRRHRPAVVLERPVDLHRRRRAERLVLVARTTTTAAPTRRPPTTPSTTRRRSSTTRSSATSPSSSSASPRSSTAGCCRTRSATRAADLDRRARDARSTRRSCGPDGRRGHRQGRRPARLRRLRRPLAGRFARRTPAATTTLAEHGQLPAANLPAINAQLMQIEKLVNASFTAARLARQHVVPVRPDRARHLQHGHRLRRARPAARPTTTPPPAPSAGTGLMWYGTNFSRAGVPEDPAAASAVRTTTSAGAPRATWRSTRTWCPTTTRSSTATRRPRCRCWSISIDVQRDDLAGAHPRPTTAVLNEAERPDRGPLPAAAVNWRASDSDLHRQSGAAAARPALSARRPHAARARRSCEARGMSLCGRLSPARPPRCPRPRAAALQTRLLSWYADNRRDLPWRRTTDPYAVLVSEIMLQQTQVPRVAPRFVEWLEAWPDLESLAAAPLADVLRRWQGLGYNNRARRLQECAAAAVAASPDGRRGRAPAHARRPARAPGHRPVHRARRARLRPQRRPGRGGRQRAPRAHPRTGPARRPDRRASSRRSPTRCCRAGGAATGTTRSWTTARWC